LYLVYPSSSPSWVTFAVDSYGIGGVGGQGNGGGAPRLVIAFTFVLSGAEFFGLARDAFAFVATAGTSALAAAAPACGITYVPLSCRFTTVVDETVVARSAGVGRVAGVAGVVGVAAEAPATAGDGGGAGELAMAAGWVDSRLVVEKSDDSNT
jgi:hypothetical protein